MKNVRNGCIINSCAQMKIIEMKAFLKGASALMVLVAAFLFLSLFPQVAKATASYGTNLVVNGNAEASDTEMTGWNESGTYFTVLTPESGYMYLPYSPDGGNVFDYFPNMATTDYMYQDIDISNLASDIALGAVSVQVSAYARNYRPGSYFIMELKLFDGSGNVLATYGDSGTTGNTWEFLTIDHSIPIETRTVRLKLIASISGENPTYDYVQFDGISLTLSRSYTYTIIADPNFKHYGSTVFGYGSAPAPQIVTITNVGNSPVTLTQPTSTNYELGALSEAFLNAGASATFTVQPKLGLEAGSYFEIIKVNTDHGTSFDVIVNFTVDDPTYTISLSPDSIDYDSMVEGYDCAPISRQVTITNTGNLPVTITSEPSSLYFDITGFFPMTIEAGGTDTFTVHLNIGLMAGPNSEMITVYTDHDTSASVHVSCTVDVATYSFTLSPDIIDFGSMVKGSPFLPTVHNVNITNTGNSPVTITSAPSSSYFDISGAFPMTIGAGGTNTIIVQPDLNLVAGVYDGLLTFIPDQGVSQSVNVTYTVYAASYTVEADEDSLNFGSVVEGYTSAPDAQTVTITNNGNSPVTITAPTSTDYVLGTLSTTNLDTGASATFTVQPKIGLTAGTYSETITVNTNHDTSDSVTVSFTVQPVSYAVEADTSSLSFSSVIVGYASAPDAQMVTITNTGNTDVTLLTPTNAYYYITALGSLTLAPSGTVRFYVRPNTGLTAGTYTETLTFSTTSLASDSVTVSFTVQAASYAVEADIGSLTFLSMIEGYASAPAAQTVTITNMGNKSVTLLTPTNAYYNFTALDPLTVAPLGTVRFDVRPKTGLTAGTYDETITFGTTSLTNDSITVSFTVQAASYAVEADIDGLSFSSVIEGYASAPAAQTVTITNRGDRDVTLLTPTNAYYDISALDPLTLSPAATARFTIQPKTGLDAGTYGESITFSTTSLTSDSVSVSFTVLSSDYTISASPALTNFQSTAEGVAPPAARTITIANTGNMALTLIQPSATHYTIGTLSALSIAPIGTATFTVQPKAGLAEGSYVETIAIQGSNGAAAVVEARFTVTKAPTYEIGASPLALAFDSLAEGYIQPDAKTVTVTNTGSQSISLYQPTAAHYVIGTLSTTALAPSSSATFSVTPKAGLSVGTFTETVQILGSGGVHTQVDVTFTCTAPNDYVILSGDGSTYQQNGSGPSSLTITSNGNINNFTGLTLNGDLVDESNYDVTQGSTIITLHQDFLDTLTPGTYTLSFHYTDGLAEAEFVIQDQMPVTGDNNALTVFGTLTLLCLIALILIRKKQTAR